MCIRKPRYSCIWAPRLIGYVFQLRPQTPQGDRRPTPRPTPGQAQVPGSPPGSHSSSAVADFTARIHIFARAGPLDIFILLRIIFTSLPSLGESLHLAHSRTASPSPRNLSTTRRITTPTSAPHFATLVGSSSAARSYTEILRNKRGFRVVLTPSLRRVQRLHSLMLVSVDSVRDWP